MLQGLSLAEKEHPDSSARFRDKVLGAKILTALET